MTCLRRHHIIFVQHEINAYVKLYYHHMVSVRDKTLFQTHLGRWPSHCRISQNWMRGEHDFSHAELLSSTDHLNLGVHKISVMLDQGLHHMLYVQHEINEYVNLYHHHMVSARDIIFFQPRLGCLQSHGCP